MRYYPVIGLEGPREPIKIWTADVSNWAPPKHTLQVLFPWHIAWYCSSFEIRSSLPFLNCCTFSSFCFYFLSSLLTNFHRSFTIFLSNIPRCINCLKSLNWDTTVVSTNVGPWHPNSTKFVVRCYRKLPLRSEQKKKRIYKCFLTTFRVHRISGTHFK